jgi:hypothetical protein
MEGPNRAANEARTARICCPFLERRVRGTLREGGPHRGTRAKLGSLNTEVIMPRLHPQPGHDQGGPNHRRNPRWGQILETRGTDLFATQPELVDMLQEAERQAVMGMSLIGTAQDLRSTATNGQGPKEHPPGKDSAGRWTADWFSSQEFPTKPLTYQDPEHDAALSTRHRLRPS